MLAIRAGRRRRIAAIIVEMRKTPLTLLVAALLAGVAVIAIGGHLSGPTRWTPDGLFYQARALEIRGVSRDAALTRTFEGPLGAQLRRIDPHRSGNPDWVAYNAQFYERRVALPAAAAALHGVAGDRALLDLSLAGYVAAVLAIFGLLAVRFRLPIAGGVALATALLPALIDNSTVPLTDSWGLAFETAAFASGLLVLERGRRWLIAWVAAILLLSFTRDSAWIPVLAALGLAITLRSRVSFALLGSGIASSLPVVALFPLPMRQLLAEMLNGIQPDPGASWSVIAGRYPHAIVDLLHADGGFVRDGAWYSALYLLAGLALLVALARSSRGSAATTLLGLGALAGVAYILVVPVFSAFRLELVLIPMAAFGLAYGVERLAAGAVLPVPGRRPAALTGRPGS
jgi:hypothetical protein